MTVSAKIGNNIQALKELFGEQSDLNILNFTAGEVPCALVSLEGMIASRDLATMIFTPLREEFPEKTNPVYVYKFLSRDGAFSNEQKTYGSLSEVADGLCSGFCCIFVEGVPKCVGISVAAYATRSISSPDGESDVMGTKESLSDSVKVSTAMIRRRVRQPNLRFEKLTAGRESKTSLVLVYMLDKANRKTVSTLKEQIGKIPLDMILTTGNLTPFITSNKGGLFSSVTTTERPDVLIAKINEGRVGILIDGIPHAIVCPALFAEHFQTVDDYASKPAYVAYVRWIRYIAFLVSVLLPGLYVAATVHHPEILSRALLINLIAGEGATPFPLLVEMLIIIILFEVLREAGLRLPKTIGGAVSILGGLVIGDAAVTSGIIPAPLLIIIGVTATCSFVVPSLHEQMALLRLANVLAAGFSGLFGMALVAGIALINACVTDSHSLPFMAPISPFTKSAIGDIVSRRTFKKQANGNINSLRGAGDEN